MFEYCIIVQIYNSEFGFFIIFFVLCILLIILLRCMLRLFCVHCMYFRVVTDYEFCSCIFKISYIRVVTDYEFCSCIFKISYIRVCIPDASQ